MLNDAYLSRITPCNIYDRENIFQNDYKGYNFFLRKYKKLDQTFLLVILVRKL